MGIPSFMQPFFLAVFFRVKHDGQSERVPTQSLAYNTIQYNNNTLLTLPWWGFSVTIHNLHKKNDIHNNKK